MDLRSLGCPAPLMATVFVLMAGPAPAATWAEGVLGTPLEPSSAGDAATYVDQLRDAARRSPVLFCAALGDDDGGRPALATQATTIGELMRLWSLAGVSSPWLGLDGDYIAWSAPPSSGAGHLPASPSWCSSSELEAGALGGCLGLLSEEQQALVAHGYPLCPADLSPLALECVKALFGESLNGEVWRDALLDRHTRLWLAYTPNVSVWRPPSGRVEPDGVRWTSLRRPLHALYAPLPSDEQRHAAVVEWRALRAADPAPPGPVPNLAPGLKRAVVRVAAEPVSLADLTAAIGASGGPRVRVDPVVAGQRVILKPGEWDALSLLRAVTAACRVSCWSQEDHVELGPLRQVLHPAIAHQVHLADQWRSRAFGELAIAASEPVPVRDLTGEQTEFLASALGRGDAPAELAAEAVTVVEPRVTVRIEVWAPLFDDLTGIQADPQAPDGCALVQDLSMEVLWFWRRLDVGSA